MIDFLAFAGSVIVYGALAMLLHELTHYTVAQLSGRQVRFNWRKLDVIWLSPARGPTWVDRAIGLAPALVGVTVVAVVFAGGLAPSVPQWIAIALYTLHGSISDYRVSDGDAADA